MSYISKQVAFFKVRASSSLPLRPGAIQCVRNCPACIKKHEITSLDKEEFEELIRIKSYEDLVAQKSLWGSQYQTIQYHVGQVDILRGALVANAGWPVIYVVAVTSTRDLKFLNMILSNAKLATIDLALNRGNQHSIVEILKTSTTIVLPIQARSCATDDDSLECLNEGAYFRAKDLKDCLDLVMKCALEDPSFNLTIVPVSIAKDHERKNLAGLGSICVNILEPYLLRDYRSGFFEAHISTHMTKHLFYDVVLNMPILPSHLVAYLILYLERYEGVTFDELVEYVDWLRKASIDTGMQIGFTGDSHCVVEFGLCILKDYIHFESKQVYIAKDTERLLDYANVVIPIFAYFGLMGRAILIEHNKDASNQVQTTFTSDTRIKVSRDKVLETCQNLAIEIERILPCRRPCRTIEESVNDTFTQMQLFKHYFKIEEPKIKSRPRQTWAGDSDSDDDYIRRNRNNPAMISWLVMTERQYRLDRLNLFVNAIVTYI